MKPRVGIVVPTLGRRPEYLKDCLESIRAGGEAYVLLVAPSSFDAQPLVALGLVDEVLEDPGTGLPEAINAGICALPEWVEFVNWLGDDDLICQGAISSARSELQSSPEAVMVFGSCDYIDAEGNLLWTNRSGDWAVPLLRFGPDLIPQPGALFRRSAFIEAGQLDPRFDWAFDFDLFIRLSKLGKLGYINQTLAQFRWHPESLSVEFRKKSVLEASRVRVSHLPLALRLFSAIWEFPVRQATLLAGVGVSSKAKKKAKRA